MTAVKRPSKALVVCRHILGSRWFVSILAVLIAFAIGAILIANDRSICGRCLLRDVPRSDLRSKRP